MPAKTASTTDRAPGAGPPIPVRPKRAFASVSAEPAASRRARAWARGILGKWRLADLADDAELIVGELVANAVVHAPAEPVRPVVGLVLALGDEGLAILVKDSNPVLPQARCPAADDLSGRGMVIVEALSDRHGWYPLEESAGKVVWALLKAASTSAATTHTAGVPDRASDSPRSDRRGHPHEPLLGAEGPATVAARPVQQPAPRIAALTGAAAHATASVR